MIFSIAIAKKIIRNMTNKDSSEIREFLISKVLLNPDRGNDNEVVKQTSYLSKQRISKPLIYIGMASCGQIAGAAETYDAIRDYTETNGIDADIIEGGCSGYCTEEPAVDIQMPGKARVSYKKITTDKVQLLLDDVLNDVIPKEMALGQYESPIHQKVDSIPVVEELPFFAHQKRLLLEHCGKIDPVSIEQYIALGGYSALADTISKFTPTQVCDQISGSELRGRGGGGYPTGEKWKITLNTVSDQKYFVCNAVESDPGSYMNRMLIESNPHHLIESLLISSYAIGASKGYIFIRSEFSLAIKRLKEALEQAYEYNIAGHNILDSGTNIEIIIKEGARAFVCGEETALINSIEGKRAMPESKPPYPATKGLWNKPTIVNNVETIYNVPIIMKNGPDWFKQTGTENSKGTKVYTLSGKVNRCGTIEVPMGISFKSIVNDIGGGLKNGAGFKAIILGINSGSYITDNHLDIKVDFEDVKEIGGAIGSGAFCVIDQSSCMVDLAKFFTNFFKNESCGKCIPCREGTGRILQILENATQRPSKDRDIQTLERFKGVMQLRSLSSVMKDTSLCSLGKSAPNAVLNTLKFFKSEFDAHVFERNCPANVCRDLRLYTIDVEACTGCTACFKKCPVDAIIGSPKLPHFIVEDKCIGCGECFDVCKFNAVLIK